MKRKDAQASAADLAAAAAEAERAVLGAALIIGSLAGCTLEESAFGSRAHALIWRAMLQLEAHGKPIDAGLLRVELSERGRLEEVGGVTFIANLMDGVARGRNLNHYADRVRAFARRRALIQRANGIRAAALEDASDGEFEDLIEGLREEVATGATSADLLTPMSEVEARMPSYLAGGLVRECGLHLWWGAPGRYKTYMGIRLVMEMTQRRAGERLFDVAGLEIIRAWRRVLWLGDEESAEEWKARAEILARGQGLEPPGAEVLFADASGDATLLTTDDVPTLLDTAGEDVDAVFIDPLANLLPLTDREGRPTKVDLDNTHALARVCRPLRRLAKQRELAVFLNHHPNATGERERGPSAYRGSADVVVEVRLDDGILTLVDLKNRDAPCGRLSFRPEWIHAPDGLSLRLEATSEPTEAQPKDAEAAASHKVRRALRKAVAICEGHPEGIGRAELVALVMDTAGCSERTAARALALGCGCGELLSDGKQRGATYRVPSLFSEGCEEE